MPQQEYVRKYMIKDIIKRNLKFWWIIAVSIIAFAALMGYKKNSEYQKRFAQIALKGTVNQYTMEYFTGNVIGDTLQMRTQSSVAVMKSRQTLNEINSLWGRNIEYSDFVDIVEYIYDGTKDCVDVRLQYPWGSDSITLLTDEDAKDFLKYYELAVRNVSDRIIGKDKLVLLGVSDLSTYAYEATDELKAAAKQAIIKHTFIGGVIGFIIPVVIITLLYLLGDKMHTGYEIAYHANQKLLATIYAAKKECNYAELGQVGTYLLYRFGKNPLKINLIFVSGTDDTLGQKLKETLSQVGISEAEIIYSNITDEDVVDYENVLNSNVNLIVAKAGKVNAKKLEKVVHVLDLVNVTGDGVIAYESAK